MKQLFFIILVVLLGSNSTASAQASPLSPDARQQLVAAEDILKVLGRNIVFEGNDSKRFAADSMFIRKLVQTLKIPNSFYYPFDSVQNISRLYAPDSAFRIFTWQYERNETFYRQRGAIQMRTDDGSLRLFPLIDMSDYTDPIDSVRTNLNWIGALYYKIILKVHHNQKYYTLIGLDDNSATSTRKWIDVLTFDEMGKPHFGGNFFAYLNDSIKPKQPVSRFCLEYKKDARAHVNYDSSVGMIVFEHLVSEDNKPYRKSTLVPDGDFEGFKWNDDRGRWEHIDKAFTDEERLQDGQAPVPMLLKDPSGKSNERMLEEQSIRNAERAEKANQQPQTPAPKKDSEQKKKLQKVQRADPAGSEY